MHTRWVRPRMFTVHVYFPPLLLPPGPKSRTEGDQTHRDSQNDETAQQKTVTGKFTVQSPSYTLNNHNETTGPPMSFLLRATRRRKERGICYHDMSDDHNEKYLQIQSGASLRAPHVLWISFESSRQACFRGYDLPLRKNKRRTKVL